MAPVLQLRSLSLMSWTDIKESLIIKPSAPVSLALASIHYVHTTLFEYQAPIASNTTMQTPFFCFNYWLARFKSQRHGSASTNKLTSGPGTFCFILWIWVVCDLFWMLPWQLAYIAGVFSRWCFFKYIIFSFLIFAVFAIQTAASEEAPQQSFPLNHSLSNSPTVIYVLKVTSTAAHKHTACSSTPRRNVCQCAFPIQYSNFWFFYSFVYQRLGSMVMQWLALLLYTQWVLGLNPLACLGPFVWTLHVPPVSMGSPRVSPAIYQQSKDLQVTVASLLTLNPRTCEHEWSSVSVVTFPLSTPVQFTSVCYTLAKVNSG